MFAFSFVVIFAFLSGFIGAIVCLKWSRPGWPRVLLGIVTCILVFAMFLTSQFVLFRFLGDNRSMDELIRTGLVLLAVCGIFWGPAFALSYSTQAIAYPTKKDAA